MRDNARMVPYLLSVTFGCGLVIALGHVLNRAFVAPVYDVVCNLVAFACAAGASVLLHHWLPTGLSLVAVTCWLVLARRTQLSLRDRDATEA